MRKRENWDDDDYMEWAESERIVRQEVAEINKLHRRQAENYRRAEIGEKNDE